MFFNCPILCKIVVYMSVKLPIKLSAKLPHKKSIKTKLTTKTIPEKSLSILPKEKKCLLPYAVIEDIVNSINYTHYSQSFQLDNDVLQTAIEGLRNRARKYLATIKIYPIQVPKLKERLIANMKKAEVSPGDPVGIMMAMAFGEPVTQMTMRTFHLAGVANATVSQGIPRLRELMDMTHMPKKKSMTVYFKDQSNNKALNLTKSEITSNFIYGEMGVYKQMVGKPLRAFVDSTEIIYLREPQWWHISYTEIFEKSLPFGDDRGAFCLRIYFNSLNMAKYGLCLLDICELVHRSYNDVYAVPASTDDMFIDIFLDPEVSLNMIENSSEKSEDYMTDKNTVYYCLRDVLNPLATDKSQKYYLGNLPINKICGISDILPREETLEESIAQRDYVSYKKWERAEHTLDLIRESQCNISSDKSFSSYKKYEDLIIKIQACVRGFIQRKIHKSRFVKYEMPQIYWLINTFGSNLKDIMNLPNVDHRRTMSNDPWEIFAVLGIEATRAFLYAEFKRLLSESYIYSANILTLIDYIDHFGTLAAVSRNGIDRREVQVLAKASFEESGNNIVTSALGAECDDLHGTSACVHLGRRGRFGTGSIDIFMEKETSKVDEVADEWQQTKSTKSVFDEDGWNQPIVKSEISKLVEKNSSSDEKQSAIKLPPKPPSKKPQKLHV